MLSATVVMGVLAALGTLPQQDDPQAEWKKALQELKGQQAVLKRELEDKNARIKELQAELEKIRNQNAFGRAELQFARQPAERPPAPGQDGEREKQAILKVVEERLRKEEERTKVEHAALLVELSKLLDLRQPKAAPGDSERKSLDEMERRLLDDLNALRALKERRADKPAEKPKTGFLGVSPELVKEGVIQVGSLVPGSPAEKAGLLQGDVIVSVAGKPIRSAADLIEQMRVHGAGASVELEVKHDGVSRRVTVVLGERKEN